MQPQSLPICAMVFPYNLSDDIRPFSAASFFAQFSNLGLLFSPVIGRGGGEVDEKWAAGHGTAVDTGCYYPSGAFRLTACPSPIMLRSTLRYIRRTPRIAAYVSSQPKEALLRIVAKCAEF